jgi:hypothetical protein
LSGIQRAIQQLDTICLEISALSRRYLGTEGTPPSRDTRDTIMNLNGAEITTAMQRTITGNRNIINTPFNTIYGQGNTVKSAFNHCTGNHTFAYGVFLVIVGSTAASTAAKTHFSVFIDPAIAKTKSPYNAGTCNQYYTSIDMAIKTNALVKLNGTLCVNPRQVIFGTAKTERDLGIRIETSMQLLQYLRDEIQKCTHTQIPSSSSSSLKKRKIHE